MKHEHFGGVSDFYFLEEILFFVVLGKFVRGHELSKGANEKQLVNV